MAPGSDAAPGRRARRDNRRWWALLAAAVVLSLALPAPHLPLRTERWVYAGPDLLSPVAPVTRVTGGDAVVPGLLRRVDRRVTQEGRLLREERVLQLRVPVPLLVLLLVWSGTRMTRAGAQPRSSATPETSRSTSSSEV